MQSDAVTVEMMPTKLHYRPSWLHRGGRGEREKGGRGQMTGERPQVPGGREGGREGDSSERHKNPSDNSHSGIVNFASSAGTCK